MLLRPIPFCWIFLAVIAPASAENPPTQETVCARLADGYFHDLYKRTYDSLIERVEPDGFFQESLTGAYPGMFPRTVGGLVSLFLETGQLDACERLVQCVLNATVANDMERVPHVFDRRRTLRVPQTDSGPLVQIGHPTALYRLNGGHLGAQGLTAPSEPIRAVEAYLTLPPTPGRLVLTLRPTPTGEPVATAELNIKSKDAGEQWVRFEMNPAPKLTTGQRYFLIIAGETEGLVVWHGISTADGQPLAGTYAYDPPPVDKWIDHKDHVTAFAVDTGQLRHQPIDLNYPILSDRDQIDGQAHVIMAWARLAIRRGPTAFEDRTYPLVARLMSRSTDWPYILTGGYPSDLGLVRNVSLEHSREVRMWDTYDILTQSFVGAALDAMIRVAQRRNDEKYATLWQKRLESLRQAVDKHLTRQPDEKKVYL